MDTVLEREPMARTRGRPKKSERDDVSVKMDRGIVAQAKMVAAAEKKSVAEYLSDMTRGLVARDFAKVMRRMEAGKEGE